MSNNSPERIRDGFIRQWIRLQAEAGQGLVEYGFTIVLIGIVVIGILAVVGSQIGDLFSEITTTFPGN